MNCASHAPLLTCVAEAHALWKSTAQTLTEQKHLAFPRVHNHSGTPSPTKCQFSLKKKNKREREREACYNANHSLSHSFGLCIFCLFIFLSGGKLFYNHMLVSAIQQHKSVIILYIPSLLSFPPLCIITEWPGWAPCVIQQLPTNYFIHDSVYMSMLLSLFVPPLPSSIVSTSLFSTRFISWRRQWHPTPVLLPGKSHRWRSLVGCSPWGHKESDTTE